MPAYYEQIYIDDAAISKWHVCGYTNRPCLQPAGETYDNLIATDSPLMFQTKLYMSKSKFVILCTTSLDALPIIYLLRKMITL